MTALPWPYRSGSILIASLFAGLTLWGCDGDGVPPAAPDAALVDASLDAGDTTTDVLTDAAFAADTADRDQDDGPDAALAQGPEWTRFTLLGGETVEGEVIATYDRSLWWDAADGALFAVFDPLGYAAYPDDRSLRFVPEEQVRATELVDADFPRPTYRAFLRNNGMHFQRPPLEHTSFVITGGESYHLEENGFGDFAWDIEKTDDAGQRYSGSGTQNEDFFVWDEPVLSAVNGVVIDVVAHGPDNSPGSHPERDIAVNNLVGIALGGSYYAYYLHFRENGVDPAVEVGTQVQVGDVLGRAGNSGVSLEPHIHMVLLWYDVAEGRSYSVPAEFSDVSVAPGADGPFRDEAWWVPSSGEWLRPSGL